MSLCILPDKAHHLAIELFGVQAEYDAGRRHIRLEHGVKVSVRDKNTHQGSKEEGVKSVFGSEAYHALSRSPMRREEVKHGMLEIHCIIPSMLGRCELDAVLSVCLAHDEAFQLKEVLFNT
jgi:hypothetical protein